MNIIDNIVNNNININSPDNDGNLLLHILVSLNKKDDILELLKHKPTIIYKNKDGETPICIAKRLKYNEIEEVLSKYCDDNNIDYNMISPVSSENNLCDNNSSNENDSEYSEYSSMSSSICSSSSSSEYSF